MSNQWLRLWHDMPNDPKWRTIARVSGQPISVVISVYLHVLVVASNATERGRTQSMCSEDIASALDVSTSDIELVLSAMQGRVIEGDKVSGWEKRQPVREDGGAERARAWREAKKNAEQTQSNATERTANAEKRPDKDTDKDTEDKKQKKHSPIDEMLSSVSDQVANDFKQLRKSKKAPITLTALETIRKESAKAHMTLEQALTMCCARGWTGFKAEWVNGKAVDTTPKRPERPFL